MKLPFLQFFTGDWLKDPTVSMLSPAARGIWLDLICVMAEHDRSGSITGTRPALARLTRCAPDELASALNELTLCGTAVVSEDADNGLVTVTNRRMQREAKARENEAKRQKDFRERHAGNAPVTPGVTPPSRSILQSTESRKQSTEPDSDKASKPFTEGGGGGEGQTDQTPNSKTQTPSSGKALRGRQTDVARLAEQVLNGQWVNDAGKWVERIREHPEKVWRVMQDVRNAAAEGTIKTTAGQMAEFLWKKVFT